MKVLRLQHLSQGEGKLVKGRAMVSEVIQDDSIVFAVGKMLSFLPLATNV